MSKQEFPFFPSHIFDSKIFKSGSANKRGQSLICLLVLFTLIAAERRSALPNQADGPDLRRTLEQAATDAAKRMIRTHMANLEIPGMQMAVISKGKLVCSESFGFADLEKRVAVTRDTAFRIGSISKSLTAAGLGLLVQRGLLDLDAPVSKYVPSFPKKPWPIKSAKSIPTSVVTR